MDIKVGVLKEELELESSTVSIKTESGELGIPMNVIKIEKGVGVDNQIDKRLDTAIKDECDNDICDSKKEKLKFEVKEEPSLDNENVESLVEIKTEELMLKSESDDDETGTSKKCSMDDSSYRKDHLESHKNNVIKKHKCDLCDYSSDRRIYLKNHILAKHDINTVKKYGCDHCDYRSHHKSHLNSHIIAKHEINPVKKHGCDHCDYRTRNKGHLNCHLIRHEKDLIKKYTCDHCDYKTHQKSCLNSHIVHKHEINPVKKHGCDHCDYRTHQKSNLKKHIQTKHNLK